MINPLLRSATGFAIAAAATFITVVGSAAPASASEHAAPSIAIDTRGIDLASPAGVARLTAEVERSARRLCSNGSDRSVAESMARRQCIDIALASAMPRLETLAAAARNARTDLAEATVPTTEVRR